jgi:hypothetical protein
MEIIKASISDVQTVMSLLSACNSELRNRGIYQWDNQYPNIGALSLFAGTAPKRYFGIFRKNCCGDCHIMH